MPQGELSVVKNPDGTVTITGNNFVTVLEIRWKSPQKKLEAVRTAILFEGYAYTEKVERMVRKELGLG